MPDLLDELTTRDSFAIQHELEQAGGPLEVAEAYVKFGRRLLTEKKDFTRLAWYIRAGIAWCLRQSQASQDAELSAKLKGQAKSMAYNLGADLWPGWAEPGVELTRADRAAGLDAALLNLRLGQELQRGPEPMGNAWWLVGAHYLADNHSAEALKHFQRAHEEFHRAGKPDFEWMTLGYVALAKLQTPATHAAGEQELQQAVHALEDLATEDSKFFATQLKDVRRTLINKD